MKKLFFPKRPETVLSWLAAETIRQERKPTLFLLGKEAYYLQGYSLARLGAPAFDFCLENGERGPAPAGLNEIQLRRPAEPCPGRLQRILRAVVQKVSGESPRRLEELSLGEAGRMGYARGEIISSATLGTFFAASNPLDLIF